MRPDKFFFAAFLLPFLGLSGCTEPATGPRAPRHAYFDVPAFIEAQIAQLEKENATLQKTVGLAAQKPETRNQANVNWQTELALFQEIDLNKKALEGIYTETSTNTPAGRKLLYTRAAGSDAPIRQLEILVNENEKVAALRAVYEQQNALFFNREERLLQTSPQGRISAITVAGVQKVLLFDSLHYRVHSVLP